MGPGGNYDEKQSSITKKKKKTGERGRTLVMAFLVPAQKEIKRRKKAFRAHIQTHTRVGWVLWKESCT
jgi:hypothetical protein